LSKPHQAIVCRSGEQSPEVTKSRKRLTSIQKEVGLLYWPSCCRDKQALVSTRSLEELCLRQRGIGRETWRSYREVHTGGSKSTIHCERVCAGHQLFDLRLRALNLRVGRHHLSHKFLLVRLSIEDRARQTCGITSDSSSRRLQVRHAHRPGAARREVHLASTRSRAPRSERCHADCTLTEDHAKL
jgi:hypothetical protein